SCKALSAAKLKSFKTIKTQGQLHGKFWAIRTDMSRECFGFLTCINATKWGHGAKSRGRNIPADRNLLNPIVLRLDSEPPDDLGAHGAGLVPRADAGAAKL